MTQEQYKKDILIILGDAKSELTMEEYHTLCIDLENIMQEQVQETGEQLRLEESDELNEDENLGDFLAGKDAEEFDYPRKQIEDDDFSGIEDDKTSSYSGKHKDI